MIDSVYIRSGLAPASGQGTPLSREEAEGKEDEFREAMRQDEEKNKPRGECGEENKGTAPPPFSGDALLRSLGGSYAPLEAQASALDQQVPLLATELAERILVNTDNRTAGGEVRITLKDSILADTEIILRQDGERLAVQLVSGNASSLDALRRAQDDLRNKLLVLGQDISVEVLDSREREGGDSSGHSDGRSRGLDYFTESES